MLNFSFYLELFLFSSIIIIAIRILYLSFLIFPVLLLQQHCLHYKINTVYVIKLIYFIKIWALIYSCSFILQNVKGPHNNILIFIDLYFIFLKYWELLQLGLRPVFVGSQLINLHKSFLYTGEY